MMLRAHILWGAGAKGVADEYFSQILSIHTPKIRNRKVLPLYPVWASTRLCGDAGVPINRPKFPHQIVEKQPQEEEEEEEEGRTILSFSIITHIESYCYYFIRNAVEAPLSVLALHDGI